MFLSIIGMYRIFIDIMICECILTQYSNNVVALDGKFEMYEVAGI